MNLFDIVDGFMTLSVLVFFVYQHRKDLKQVEKTLDKAHADHLTDVKRMNEEYKDLLERALVRMEQSNGAVSDRLTELEGSLKMHINHCMKS